MTRSELPDPMQIDYYFGLMFLSEDILVGLGISSFLKAGIKDVWAESIFLVEIWVKRNTEENICESSG